MSICFEKFSTAELYCLMEGRISFVCFRSWLKGLLSIFKRLLGNLPQQDMIEGV